MAVVLDATRELIASVDTLCAVDPARLADAESVQALHRQLERLKALSTRVEAAWLACAAGCRC